jgi:hypothetical protein
MWLGLVSVERGAVPVQLVEDPHAGSADRLVAEVQAGVGFGSATSATVSAVRLSKFASWPTFMVNCITSPNARRCS